MTPQEEASDQLRLVHPVYLDVPMMVSFLAALEGGVAFEDESVRRRLTGAQRDREGGGKVRLPSLGSLVGFDLSGRMGSKEREEDSEEVKAVRQHTAASLFNALLHRLQEDGYVEHLQDLDQLGQLRSGQLVEVTGAFIGNPLEELLAVFGKFLPYLLLGEEASEGETQAPEPRNPRRSGNPAMRAQAEQIEEQRRQDKAERAAEALEREFGLRVMAQMETDIEEARVHDMVLDGPGGARVVLTLASEFFTESTSEYLLAGNFTAFGKVTRVLDEGDEINLTRRTVLGAFQAKRAQELIVESVEKAEEIEINTSDPIIKAPAVQLLPLAVFV